MSCYGRKNVIQRQTRYTFYELYLTTCVRLFIVRVGRLTGTVTFSLLKCYLLSSYGIIRQIEWIYLLHFMIFLIPYIDMDLVLIN